MTATTVKRLAKPVFTQKFAQDVNAGLSAKPKHLESKYFYDYTGLRLFDEICGQPEYYIAKTEASILEHYSSVIADMHSTGSDVIILELGSGSSSKTRILLRHLLEFEQNSIYYPPIDIVHSTLQSTVDRLSMEFPRLDIRSISAEYLDGIKKAYQFISDENISSARKIVVILGSSIGNFEPEGAVSFLNTLADRLNGRDSLLIGFDLQKDEHILNAAYNDSAGITAKFNLNMLARINKELGGEFDLNLFKHHAFYNKEKGRIEMHLLSTCKQQAYVSEIDKFLDFEKGESIHTKNSYKYTLEQIEFLARKSNLKVKKHFSDERRWFDLAMFEGAN